MAFVMSDFSSPRDSASLANSSSSSVADRIKRSSLFHAAYPGSGGPTGAYYAATSSQPAMQQRQNFRGIRQVTLALSVDELQFVLCRQDGGMRQEVTTIAHTASRNRSAPPQWIRSAV
jgi:hypothetical protein